MDLITLAMAKSYTDKALNDRIGYTESVSIVPEAEYTFQHSDGLGNVAIFENVTLSAHAKDGTILTVHFDGAVYECTVYEMEGTFVAGNLAALGVGEDTGEPFTLADLLNNDSESMVLVIISNDTDEKHRVGISAETETIHPIDPKYIPWDSAPGGGSGGLPVVELETVPTAEGTPLSESDIAKLEAANFALPCILKCSLPSFLIDAPVDFLAQGVSSVENNAYLAAGVIDLSVLGMFGVAITNQGDGWVAIDISVPNNSPDV